MTASTLEPASDPSPAGAAAEREVQRSLSGRVRGLQLEIGDRGLILRGQAYTYYVKQLAQHVVMQATGMPIQANHIEVL
jgi:hypothetical protein